MTDQSTQQTQSHATQPDEISLIDIWLVLRQHKRAMIWAFGVTLALGLIAVTLTPKKYEIRTSVQIGTAVQGGSEVVAIESPETVMAKLENSFIPSLRYELHNAKNINDIFDINVRIPKNSSLIVLNSKTTKDKVEIYKEFHNKLVHLVVKDHSKLLNVLKKNLTTDIERAKIELDGLQDKTTLNERRQIILTPLTNAQEELKKLTDDKIFGLHIREAKNRTQEEKFKLSELKNKESALKAQLKRLTTNQELLRDEITTITAYLEKNNQLRNESVIKIQTENSAMTQLLIDNDIQENQQRLFDLKEKLHVELENAKSQIEISLLNNVQQQLLQQELIEQAKNKLTQIIETNKVDQAIAQAKIDELESKLAKTTSDHSRMIAFQQQSIGELESKLENFVETEAVVPPTRSILPVSMSTKFVILLTLVIGLFVALLAAFLANLRVKARQATAKHADQDK